MSVRVDTPQKIRFLKYIYEQKHGVKPGEIAETFGIRGSTVTRSLLELKEAGCIQYDPYQTVLLTESGEELSKFFHRRHRILSLMFARAGLSAHDACLQAEKIEHLVPREHIDQICRCLGHPRRSVCGIIDYDPGCCGAVL
jgi:Mn-dependent DtxR family transcriptional regulator